MSTPGREILELTPPPAPPARGRLGAPDEDAWNRLCAADVKLRRHAHRLELGERRRNTEAAYLATPGYDDPHVAFRETLRDLDSWEGRELRRLGREVASLQGTRDATAEGLILTARKSAESCQGRHVLVKCGCGGGSARLVEAGCERTSCVRCAPRVTADRARRVVTKLEASLDAARVAIKKRTGHAPAPALFAFRVSVLTMPPSERGRYTSKADWTALRRRVWHMLRDEFSAAWACVTTHPVGDENPEVFHPHLNVLWAKRGLARGMMPPEELERLKRRWAELLGVEGPVDVHGSFVRRTDDKRIRHRARYYARVFVGWKFWLPKAVQWFGEYVKNLETICVCPDCGGQFSILAMGDQAVQLYLRLLETAPQRPAPPPGSSGAGRSELLEGVESRATLATL